MLNLVLYSDQIIPENLILDTRLLELIKTKTTGTRIAYVPSGPEPDRQFFNLKKSYYARYGLDLSLFFDLNKAHSAKEIAELFNCDAIHLSGGQTGAFLQRLRFSGIFEPLRNWAMRGGILIGTSAGAILMTPTIAVDALFSGGKPKDLVGSIALDLLPFEFFPHLNAKETYLSELMQYSTLTAKPIVAVNDGAGVIVSNQVAECIGNPLWIFRGAIKRASDIKLRGLSISERS